MDAETIRLQGQTAADELFRRIPLALSDARVQSPVAPTT
jgi:hypothetical protein